MLISLGHLGTLIEKLRMMVLHSIFFATLLKTWKCLHFLEKAKELAHVIEPANSHLWLGYTLYSANQSLNPMWFLFFWVSPKRSLRFPLAPSAKVAKQYFIDCGDLVHFKSHHFYFQNLVPPVSGRDFNHTPIWASSTWSLRLSETWYAMIPK